MPDVLIRLQSEYREMPGLALTSAQAARLLATPGREVLSALERLVQSGFLRRNAFGAYLRA